MWHTVNIDSCSKSLANFSGAAFAAAAEICFLCAVKWSMQSPIAPPRTYKQFLVMRRNADTFLPTEKMSTENVA